MSKKYRGNPVCIGVRFDAHTALLLDEMAELSGVQKSTIIRAFTARVVAQLTDEDGYLTPEAVELLRQLRDSGVMDG